MSAAAEASVAPARGLITEADIDRGYDACAIVRVCELAMEQIPELGAVGDIVRMLRMVGQMTGASLNVLELAKTRQADTKA